MISLTSIAAAAAALALGGTGSAALVMNAPPTHTDAATTLTAKANADLGAAEHAQQLAIAALSDTTAEGKAEAQTQIELATARLEQASADMKAAVNSGSKAAIDAFTEFSGKSVRLVNSLATTASSTANGSVKVGTDLVRAVDTQIGTARGVASAQGTAAVQALTQVRSELPGIIGGATGTVSSAVPSSSASVSTNVEASTSATGSPAGLGLVSATAGQVGVLLGGK